MEVVLRKCTDSLLIDHQVFGTNDRTVEFGGWRALYEEIVLLHPLKSGLSIGNFRMAFGKSQSHMDNLKLFPSGKFHGFGCIGDDGLSTGGKSQNPFLEIESQQSCFFRIKFHVSSFLVFSMTSKITAMPSSNFLPVTGGKILYRVHILLCRLQANTSRHGIALRSQAQFYPPSIRGMRITASKTEADQMIDDFGHGRLGDLRASGQFADLVFSILNGEQNPKLSKGQLFNVRMRTRLWLAGLTSSFKDTKIGPAIS